MAEVRQKVPEGRYGRTTGSSAARGGPAGGAGRAEARTDRRLKLAGGVFGVLLLALVGWLGISYIAGQDVSAEVIKYKVVSDSAVEVHLEVHKDKGVAGVCTLRSRAEDGAEVGRKTAAFDAAAGRVDKVITLRTTARATNAELLGCERKH